MIPQDIVDQVRQATDIVQTISEYLKLKKRGRNHVGLCPFHTEKTPSFSVSEDKQIFHCFGCGKGGNVYTFLMEHERMSFVDSVKFLARKAGITIQEEPQSAQSRERSEKTAYANQLALEFYKKQLLTLKYQSILNDYLISKRKINREAIDFFQLGLAGSEWDSLVRHCNNKGLGNDDLVEAGVALRSESKGNYFDRFRQRLMIPIFSLSHKPIAFGGRTLKKGEPAKYMNSPETSLYHKSNVLYGLNFARDAIRDSNEVFVVEGYFDVISLWQIGIKNVVASSGTAFTAQQARLLARFAETVYLFFDADSAGRNAAIKSVDSLYDAGLEVMVIDPPAGEDPDSLARDFGPDKIDELKHDALSFIPYRIRTEDINSAGIIAKEKLIKELASIGEKIADPTRRSLFFEEASKALNVQTSIFRVGPSRNLKSESEPKASRRYDQIEYSLLSLLLNEPGGMDTVFQKISSEDFDSKQLARLYSAIIEHYRAVGEVKVGRLLDTISEDDSEFKSLITEVGAREWPENQIDSELVSILTAMQNKKSKQVVARLKKELNEAEQNGDQEKAAQILEQIKGYQQR